MKNRRFSLSFEPELLIKPVIKEGLFFSSVRNDPATLEEMWSGKELNIDSVVIFNLPTVSILAVGKKRLWHLSLSQEIGIAPALKERWFYKNGKIFLNRHVSFYKDL